MKKQYVQLLLFVSVILLVITQGCRNAQGTRCTVLNECDNVDNIDNISSSTPRATAVTLTNVDNTSDATLLDAAQSLTTAVIDGTTYLFVAAYDANLVHVFSVDKAGQLTNEYHVSDDATLMIWGTRSLTTAVIDGTTYLFVAGYIDHGVSVFSVDKAGQLNNVDNTSDQGDLKLWGAYSVTTTVIDGTTYLFVAGYNDGGVSVFSVDKAGQLNNVDNTSDHGDLKLSSSRSVTTTVIGDTTYLFVAGETDDGVSVFSVDKAGQLNNVDNTSDHGDLKLRGAYSVTTTVIDGTTYLFVAGYIDHGVSVFSVDKAGQLNNVDNTSDHGDLELLGASSVTTTIIDGGTFLFVAGEDDDGVSVFSVDNDGQLTNVDNTDDADKANLEIKATSSLITAVIGGTTYLFVAGKTDNGVSVFSVTPSAYTNDE